MKNLAFRVRKILVSMVKRLARPFMVRLHGLVLRWTDDQITEMRFKVDGLERYVPVILNSIQTQNALSRANTRARDEVVKLVYSTLERFQFVRNELLYELRYGQHVQPQDALVEPKVLNHAKVEANRDALRVNLGCGHIPLSEYINIDLRPLDGVDVTADVRELPFEPDSVAEIYSAHLIEHFPEEELRRRVLPHWVSRLRPGGTFVAIVPDATTMIAEYVAGGLSFDTLREVTFGDQEYDGDFHFTMFTPESLTDLLTSSGLEDVAMRVTGRRNGACYEMEVEARKPLPAEPL
jgi:SAM-dependent methyltransferase